MSNGSFSGDQSLPHFLPGREVFCTDEFPVQLSLQSGFPKVAIDLLKDRKGERLRDQERKQAMGHARAKNRCLGLSKHKTKRQNPSPMLLYFCPEGSF